MLLKQKVMTQYVMIWRGADHACSLPSRNPRCERSGWSVGPAALDRPVIGQWDTTLVQLPVGFGEHPGRKRGKPTWSGIEPGNSKPGRSEQHTPKTS